MARRVLFVLGIVPWLASLVAALPAVHETSFAKAFGAFCHQRLDRTLFWGEHPMVVCSRCAGFYAGLALGAALGAPRATPRQTRRLLAVAGAAMLLDVVTQELGLHPTWHASRLSTGALIGFALAIGLLSNLRDRGKVDPTFARPSRGIR